jgi:hypothetical protein
MRFRKRAHGDDSGSRHVILHAKPFVFSKGRKGRAQLIKVELKLKVGVRFKHEIMTETERRRGTALE